MRNFCSLGRALDSKQNHFYCSS